jgi:signal transduction histidine kinase
MRMAAVLSHELRTPLNAIAGSISLLERVVPEGSQDRVHVDRLKRNSRHLMAMLDDVLELVRVESGERQPPPGRQSFRSVVDEALADVELHAGTRGVAIVNAVSGVDPDVLYWGDDRRVRQIIVNLLTNAIKFTASGGRVTVSAGLSAPGTAAISCEDLLAFVRIEDTGRGVPPAHTATIFEPFQQVEHADRSCGEGLGLAISREFARNMGGDITLVSEVAVGSTFTLWLPADQHRVATLGVARVDP